MLKYYYDNKFKIFKLSGKLHDCIVLYKHNYYQHIKAEHPEVSIEKIITVLEDPDFIYKMSNTSKDFYYEKMDEKKCNFRVVIGGYKQHIKVIVTAYKLKNDYEFDIKHTYCIYDKNMGISEEQLKSIYDEELAYYNNLFQE